MTLYSIWMPLPPCMSRAARAMSSASPQLLRLTIEIISGAARPSSISRPTLSEPGARARSWSACRRASSGRAGSAASGRPNCLRSRPYWRAREPAILRRAHRAPGDAVAGAIEAAERPLESRDVRQKRALRRLDIVEHDLAGDRGAQGKLALDLRRGEALHALLEDEAADLVVVRARLRPDDEHVGERRVADPGLGADEPVAAVDLLGSRRHAAGIGAGVRLGEPEAADELAAREAGQVLAPLVVVAIGVDRIHDERALHAHHRAKAESTRSTSRATSP